MEIWADAECTRRPSGVVQVLYAQFNRRFVFGEATSFGQLDISTPTADYPDDPFGVVYNVDFVSEDQDTPLEGVVRLSAGNPEVIGDGWEFSFGPVID